MENESNNNGIKIVTGILAVLLVVAGAFAVKLYNQEKDTKSQLTQEKNVVLSDLKAMVDKYDVVIEENNLKDSDLNDARDRIQQLIGDIGSKDATIASLGKYRTEVFKLRKERDFLFTQNDSLRGSNQLLAMRVDSTSCYTVPQNRLSEAGDRMLYVQVIDPKKNILGANKSIEFESGKLTYSAISKFYYENQALDICENIAPKGEEFEPGVYSVNVFDGETLIAQTSFTLK